MRTRLLSRGEVSWDPAAPFDVPVGDDCMGFRRDGPVFIGVLAVAPGPPRPAVIGAPMSVEARLLAVVAGAFTTRDAAPFAIDVVSHTMGCWGTSAAARSYRSLLGGLRIAAHRSVHVVVRIRPADHPAAVRTRGDGGVGEVRTALWCLRRVRARLAEAGIAARPLAASEIVDLTLRLTEGVPATTVAADRSRLAVYALPDPTPGSLAALLASPVSQNAVSTTVTVRVCAGTAVQIVVRDNGGHGLDRTGEHGLVRAGAASPALWSVGLPIGPPPARRREPGLDDIAPPVGSDIGARLCAVPVPLAGDGQLVGADASGRPVVLRLAGPGIARSDVVGDAALARQVTIRLAALGFAVGIASDDPESWRGLAGAVGLRRWTAAAASPPVQVLVDDTDDGIVNPPLGATLVRLHRPGASPTGGGPSLHSTDAEGRVRATGDGCQIDVGLVSTDAERELLAR